MSKLVISVPLKVLEKSIQLASLPIERREKVFRVIAFSGLYYEMFHNHNREDCAVRLEIISVNMSCNCQISPLERPNPTEAYSLPQCWGFGSKEFQEAIWPRSRTMATKQSVPSISPANQPLELLDPPRTSLNFFSLFTPFPFQSQSSYYHWHVPKPIRLMFILTSARVCFICYCGKGTSIKERANITFTFFNVYM